MMHAAFIVEYCMNEDGYFEKIMAVLVPPFVLNHKIVGL